MSQSPASAAASQRARERAAKRQKEIEEEIVFLHEHGLHPEWWPAKVGLPTLSAVEKRMRKYPEIRSAIGSAMALAKASKR